MQHVGVRLVSDGGDLGLEVVAKVRRLRGSLPAQQHITGEFSDQRFDPGRTVVFFESATVRRVNFSGVRFEAFLTRGSTFTECDFSRIKSGTYRSDLSSVPPSVYSDCRFDRADLRAFDPGAARFERCSFRGSKIDGWNTTEAEFVDCTFAGRINQARFWGQPYGVLADRLERTINEFRGNDFSGADLWDVSFVKGIDIDAQRWPAGAEYIRLDRMQERLNQVRRQVVHWANPHARQEALIMLQVLQEDVELNQNALFARRATLSGGLPERERVWDMLAASLDE